MQSTTDYNIFKFRDDNRNTIDFRHVGILKESIRKCNKLHDHPIRVNSDMEVINGQHRLLAARDLGVPIFYEQIENYTIEDLFIDNLSKQWSPMDYLNFFCKNGYQEYIKLKNFMEKHRMALRTALYLSGSSQYAHKVGDYRNGTYKFASKENDEDLDRKIDCIWNTVNRAKAAGVKGTFLMNVNFWRAMFVIASCQGFREERWLVQLDKLVHRITIKARMIDYAKMFQAMYNYHSLEHLRIQLPNEVMIDP